MALIWNYAIEWQLFFYLSLNVANASLRPCDVMTDVPCCKVWLNIQKLGVFCVSLVDRRAELVYWCQTEIASCITFLHQYSCYDECCLYPSLMGSQNNVRKSILKKGESYK